MEWTIRILSFLQSILLIFLRPIYWYINRERPPTVPAIKNSLLTITAVELAKKIRQREISSESIVEAYIDRIKEVNPIVNAVVEHRFEAALRDARICDKKLEAGEVNAITLEVEQPLYGIPFTVKESCSLKGLSHTGCTLVRQGTTALSDSFVVETLKNAGGIPLCVTNTPELCLGFETSNHLFGRTCNPYDARHSAGGSSGGECALLGAGASLIGIGSDIGGSIRLPALFNGVFGHKPTPGVISIKGHYPYSEGTAFQKYLVVGPLTRYWEDLDLTMKIMSAKSPINLRLGEPVDVKKLKVFYMHDSVESFGVIPAHEDIKRVIRKASKYLEGCGSEVIEVAMEEMKESLEVALSLFFAMEDVPQILINPDDPKHERNVLTEAFKALLGLSQYTKMAIFVKFLKDANAFISQSKLPHFRRQGEVLREKFIKMLGTDGVFLYPTFTKPAPLHNQMALQITAIVYCLIFNVLGFPSTQVPMGLNNNGLPVGFQIVAAPNQDRLCLAVAKELANGFGGWIPPTMS